MTIFESSSFWIVAFLIGWTAIAFVLGPRIGRLLKHARREQTNHYPFPSGSILDVNHPERVS